MAEPLSFAAAVDAEELARAELYGLLAQLWLAPPDAAMLERFSAAADAAPESGGVLDAPWRELVAVMRATTAAAAADEHDALFHGVGKPEVLPYGSYFLAGFLNERPLARLRHDLATLGLEREPGRLETEDHIACEFEAMRWLITGDAEPCNLARQRRFFRAHLQPWVGQLCDKVQSHPRAATWRAVAALTRAFMQVEAEGFDLLES